MVVGAGPEWQEMMQTPGEFVARMGVDRLEQPQDDPDVHGDDMQVLGDGAEDNGDADGAECEDHRFKW